MRSTSTIRRNSPRVTKRNTRNGQVLHSFDCPEIHGFVTLVSPDLRAAFDRVGGARLRAENRSMQRHLYPFQFDFALSRRGASRAPVWRLGQGRPRTPRAHQAQGQR